MNSVKRSNLFFIIVLIAMILGSILIGSFNLNSSISMVLTQYLFLLLPVVIYFKITKLPVKETMRLNKLSLKNIVIVLFISLLSLPIVTFIASLSSMFFHNYFSDAVSSFPSMPLVGWIAVIGLTPAICEEAVMRGIVLGGYKNIDIKKAAIINGLLFGILHLNLNQFFYAFALGIIMAYIVYATNSIFASVIMHFTINSISATANWWVSKSAIDPTEITNASGISNTQIIIGQSFWAVICLFLLILLIKKLIKMNSRNNHISKVKENRYRD